MTTGLPTTLGGSHPSPRGTRARRGRIGRRQGCHSKAGPTVGLDPAEARCPAGASSSMQAGHRRARSIRRERRLAAMRPGDEPRRGAPLAGAHFQRQSGQAGRAPGGRQQGQKSGKRSRTRAARLWHTASLPDWRCLPLSATPGSGLASAGGRSTRARTISVPGIGLASCASCTSRFWFSYSPPASRWLSSYHQDKCGIAG